MVFFQTTGSGEQVLLYEDGALKASEECCCGEFECCCTRISQVTPPPTLKGRFVGDCASMGGVEFDLNPETVPAGVCRKWRGQVTVSGPDCISLITVQLECSKPPNTPSGCEDYYIRVTYHNDQCATDQSSVDVYPTGACQCDPTFYAQYCGFALVNGLGPNCDCCDSFCIEVYEEAGSGSGFGFSPMMATPQVEITPPPAAPIPAPQKPPSPPSIVSMGWNLARSLAAFVSDGCKFVDDTEYKRRLEICEGCDQRKDNRCLKCGCNLAVKAKGRAFKCPIGKWEAAPLVDLTIANDSRNIPVFMTAAPRDISIQSRAIQSVRQAGFTDLTVLCEPGTAIEMIDATFPESTVILHSERQGQWRNLIAAIRAGVESGSQFFITMEDDVVLHHQLAEFLQHKDWHWPSGECGCLQLYSSEKLRSRYQRGSRSKLRCRDAEDMLGACALLFRRDAAQTLVNWADQHGWRGDTGGVINEPQLKKAGDTFIGEVLTHSGYEIWIHNPSLADHIGVGESTLGHYKHTPNRRTLDFPVNSDLFSIFTTASNMKIIALYKTFDGGEFIDASLASVYDNVDAIVMVHSDVSWLGERGNTVRASAIAWCEKHDHAGKVHHVDVSLTSQEGQYEAGLNYIAKHKLPHNVILAIDADEVWEDQYFERARRQMTDKSSIGYRCNMHTYLKNPFFRVEPAFGSPTVFLKDPRWLLKSPRGCRAPALQLDNVWMHHFTYVRESREAVERKLHQSCLADGNETVVQNWMTEVYDRMPAGENLHAFERWRHVWRKIEKVWLPELPPAMRKCNLMNLWMPEGHLLDGEQAAIMRLAKGRRQAVDLGTYQGLSAAILALACDKVHTIDAYEDIKGKGTFADTLIPDRYESLNNHSLEATKALCARYGNMTCEQADTINAAFTWTGGDVDVLFVDADHSEESTTGNVEAWLLHMKPGARIILHDNNDIHPGVQRAIAELRTYPRLQEIEPGDYAGSLAAFEVK